MSISIVLIPVTCGLVLRVEAMTTIMILTVFSVLCCCVWLGGGLCARGSWRFRRSEQLLCRPRLYPSSQRRTRRCTSNGGRVGDGLWVGGGAASAHCLPTAIDTIVPDTLVVLSPIVTPCMHAAWGDVPPWILCSSWCTLVSTV